MMKHIQSDKSNSNIVTCNIATNQVQPNALDLKVDKFFEIRDTVFQIDEEKKIHRGADMLMTNSDGIFHLEKNKSYEVLFEGEIEIAEGEAGWIVPRSTLNRNGLFITSGLYDSGYKGVLAGVLHVTCGDAVIKRGTRLGQFVLFDAETVNLYDGDYGTGKFDDRAYNK